MISTKHKPKSTRRSDRAQIGTFLFRTVRKTRPRTDGGKISPKARKRFSREIFHLIPPVFTHIHVYLFICVRDTHCVIVLVNRNSAYVLVWIFLHNYSSSTKKHKAKLTPTGCLLTISHDLTILLLQKLCGSRWLPFSSGRGKNCASRENG